jgi:pilus assembly protein CpaB
VNPRQRRGAFFMLLALVIGLGVFVSVTSYVANVESQVGSKTTVYRASKTINPYTPLNLTNLEPVEIPERWSAATTRLEIRQLEARRIGFKVEAGTVISSDMLLSPSSLNPDEREIAINVDPVTGIGGRVVPGARVDIYAVFADVDGLSKQVRVLVRNVRVVSVHGRQTIQQNDDNGTTQADVVPVTLALTPSEALSVTYANAFAKEVRLVGLPTDVGTNRADERNSFDARQLGGHAVPERNK